MALRHDPEWWAFMSPILSSAPPPPVANTASKLRSVTDKILTQIFSAIPSPSPPSTPIIQTVIPIPTTTRDGKPSTTTVPLTRFATQAQMDANPETDAQPAILYIHGGGMVSGTVPIFAPQITVQASKSGVQIWAIDYRLAPEHPFPTPLNDCYAALTYLNENHTKFGIDAKRICIMGDSAGGGLAAGVALMARDKKLNPQPAKQILIYPMLDDRTVLKIRSGDGSQLHPFLTWTAKDNALGWESYLGAPRSDVTYDEAISMAQARKAAEEGGEGVEGVEGVCPYAAPARARDLRGLPSTYMDTGGLDLFVAEDAAFAAQLAVAEVEVEFHLFAGVPHGFEGASVGVVERALEGRVSAMRSF